MWRYGSTVLILDTKWRLASFKPVLLYPRGYSPRYQLDRKLGGPIVGQDDVKK
jgi:hypothetical protein